MKAKDTVMSEEQLLAIENKFHLGEELVSYKTLLDYDIDRLIAHAQAKISFKLGYNQALKDIKDGLSPSDMV